MNYNEYFGKNPNTGWGTSGKAASQNEEWSDYFENQTVRVPIQKMYADSPVVTTPASNKGKTYLDVDPLVVQRPTHEQMIIERSQRMQEQAMIQQQKDYYGRIWDNKVNQMEEEDVPAVSTPKERKKLSFVDKPKEPAKLANELTIDENLKVTDSPTVENKQDVPTFDIPFIPEYHEPGEDELYGDYEEEEQNDKEIPEETKPAVDEEPIKASEELIDETPVISEDDILDGIVDEFNKKDDKAEDIVPIIPGEAEIEAIVEEPEEDNVVKIDEPSQQLADDFGGLDPTDLFAEDEEPMIMDPEWVAQQEDWKAPENANVIVPELKKETEDELEANVLVEPVKETKKTTAKKTSASRKKPVVSTNKKKTATSKTKNKK